MGGSIYMATGVVLIIFGIAAVVLGNVSLHTWLHNGGRNGGTKK